MGEKKKTKTKKQAQPSHLPHSPTRIEPAEGAISAGSHGGSGEPLKPITVARASMLDQRISKQEGATAMPTQSKEREGETD